MQHSDNCCTTGLWPPLRRGTGVAPPVHAQAARATLINGGATARL